MTAHFRKGDALAPRRRWLVQFSSAFAFPVAAALLTAGLSAQAGASDVLESVEVVQSLPAEASPLEAAPAEIVPSEPVLPEPAVKDLGVGVASYYGDELAGNRTANGERFDPGELTAAHRSLPFGSRVKVTSTRTGKSVVVRINDRGPFHGNRVIDLSEAAAREIGLISRGSGPVQMALLGR